MLTNNVNGLTFQQTIIFVTQKRNNNKTAEYSKTLHKKRKTEEKKSISFQVFIIGLVWSAETVAAAADVAVRLPTWCLGDVVDTTSTSLTSSSSSSAAVAAEAS